MSEQPLRFYWLQNPDDPEPPSPWRTLSEADYQEAESRGPGGRGLLIPAPNWADDIERFGRAVFAADKLAHRERSFDLWTRHIRLSVPVSSPDRWQRALPHLTTMLETITGDRWELCFRNSDERSNGKGAQGSVFEFTPEDLAEEVALFSGGLDSLGWIAQRTTTALPRPLLLISFEEPRLISLQNSLYETLLDRIEHRKETWRRLPQSQSVGRKQPTDHRNEPSSRTRGLLYTTSAVHAAAAEHVPVVHLPENGQLAVNPPLSAARAGACSTRSVHPWTLHHLNRAIEEIAEADSADEPRRVVRVENPFAALTKGEVCNAAKDVGLPREVLESTLSCGAPPIRQPNQLDFANCGACFPCLIRRSGMLAAFGDDQTPYLYAPWETESEDWQALRRWLDTPLSTLDLLADTPLPPEASPTDLLDVVEQGRTELRTFVTAGLNGRIRTGS